MTATQSTHPSLTDVTICPCGEPRESFTCPACDWREFNCCWVCHQHNKPPELKVDPLEHRGLIGVALTRYFRVRERRLDEELEQVALLALVKAAVTWDPERGAFSTWGVWQIRGAVRTFLRRERRAVRSVTVRMPDGERHDVTELVSDEQRYRPRSRCRRCLGCDKWTPIGWLCHACSVAKRRASKIHGGTGVCPRCRRIQSTAKRSPSRGAKRLCKAAAKGERCRRKPRTGTKSGTTPQRRGPNSSDIKQPEPALLAGSGLVDGGGLEPPTP